KKRFFLMFMMNYMVIMKI
ncbi:orf206.CDS.1, partial (mitochondrion) [Saccharomyces cerevisiae]